MIAALFVHKGGAYYGLPDVDPWDEERDARLYAGPYPVVAHPPCARWSKLAPLAASRGYGKPGEDGGCFASALASVRRWGGVLEHPAHSAAWRAFGIIAPPASGGWVRAGVEDPGWTCHVEQGHYGHKVRKPTWLYAVGVNLPSLVWGRAPEPVRSPHWTPRRGDVGMMWSRDRIHTPPAFRDELLAIARSAARTEAA